MSLSTYLRLLIALLSGAALAFAFPTYNLPVLAWVAVAVLMIATIGAHPGMAALCGFLHGAAFFTLSVPWIYTVMRVHGNVEPLPAAGILALMVATLSLFPMLFSLCVCALGRRSIARACLAAPFLWVALEFLRGHMPVIGFPWNLLGYAAASNILILQLTPLAGIYGLSMLVAGFNALFAWVVLAPAIRRRRAVITVSAVGILVLAAAAFGGRWVPRAQPDHVARLVQTNFPEPPSFPANWMELHAAEMEELERISAEPARTKPDLVVWPEVPAPFSLQDRSFAARAEEIARQANSDLLIGVVDWKLDMVGGMEPYNSAVLLNPSGRVDFVYDKIHLVPFGEYVPLRRWLSFAGKITAQVGDFRPGAEYRLGPLANGKHFGVFICYEAIFPNQVRRFVRGGANLLINISNDGWFGRSAAPAQHLAMARVRAVENRRWLLRDTNNGFTVSVDPYGRYAARLAPDVRAALDAPYGLRTDLTAYARWGDWLAWLCVILSAGFLFTGVRLPASGNTPAAVRRMRPERKRKKSE